MQAFEETISSRPAASGALAPGLARPNTLLATLPKHAKVLGHLFSVQPYCSLTRPSVAAIAAILLQASTLPKGPFIHDPFDTTRRRRIPALHHNRFCAGVAVRVWRHSCQTAPLLPDPGGIPFPRDRESFAACATPERSPIAMRSRGDGHGHRACPDGDLSIAACAVEGSLRALFFPQLRRGATQGMSQ
jgi:hypothetical protein